RHNKIRILKPDFIKLLARKQVKNGILYIFTDCKIYANYIMSVINSISEYTSILNNIDYLTIFNSRIVTNFEKKANILNKKIFNLLFQCSKL
ncbi:tRNA (guanosine(46)-N7)-methyltransferase TrmB, partial [Buchnera aphidicola (Stegophylla sp.)]|nr:tRNA (guanosine(46)-N7)-methyltransferase TrmB [Buchnera aphidicola (Stegophylla sp.)]